MGAKCFLLSLQSLYIIKGSPLYIWILIDCKELMTMPPTIRKTPSHVTPGTPGMYQYHLLAYIYISTSLYIFKYFSVMVLLMSLTYCYLALSDLVRSHFEFLVKSGYCKYWDYNSVRLLGSSLFGYSHNSWRIQISHSRDCVVFWSP